MRRTQLICAANMDGASESNLMAALSDYEAEHEKPMRYDMVWKRVPGRNE
jgi:hypothetical protein